MECTYQPRNDFVICKVVPRGKSQGGIAIPEIGAAGMSTFVVAVGPQVQDLKPGDEILVATSSGVGYDVADVKDHFATKQEFITCVLRNDA
jgi:hypothetical protein